MKSIEHDTGRYTDVFGNKESAQRATTYWWDSATELFEEEVPSGTMHSWLKKRNLDREYGWFNGQYHHANEVLPAMKEVAKPLWEPAMNKQKMISAPINKVAAARVTKRRRKRIRGDYGNELDIHEVNQGRVDRAWTRTKFVDREVHESKHVTILVNASMSAMVKASSAEWRTAALLQIHDELVRMGKSVEVAVYWSTKGSFRDSGTNINFFYIPVKKAGQSLSRKHLAMYTSATYARLIALNKAFNMTGRPVVNGYGFPFSSYESIPYPAQQMKEKGHHVVIVSQCFSQSAANSAVEKAILQVQKKDATPEAMSARQQQGLA